MRVASLLLSLALAACGGGSVMPGQRQCGPDTPCPGDEVCSGIGVCVGRDGGPPQTDAARTDAPPADAAPADACAVACGAGCCGAGEVCLDGGACKTDLGGCQQNGECQADSHCVDGHCIPYEAGESNPECHRVVVIGMFSPTLHCEWKGGEAGDPYPDHVQVLSTPVVVDFDFDGTPVTRKPALVFASYNQLDGACGLGSDGTGATGYGILRVVDGKTCQTLYTIDAAKVNGASTPSVGDLDGDGRPEIVALSATGGLVAFRYDPAQGKFVVFWVSHNADGTASNPAAAMCMWTGPSLADLDDDGVPEALLGGVVYDATGKVVDDHLGALHTMGTGIFPVLADVDGDGRVELVDGATAYSFDPPTHQYVLRASGLGTAGWTAVADFGTFGANPAADSFTTLDQLAEIAVVGGGLARIQTVDGRVVFGPVSLPGSSGGGPPTIGDFDGDGLPELAAAGSDSYTIFDPNCKAAAPDPVRCPTPRDPTGVNGFPDGILWSSASQDHSSNVTGSSIFDFDGDGHAEAIYADECYVRVYRGADGVVIFSQPRTSCTWHENPIVADVDGSFQSKLVVPSNENCSVQCAAVDPMFTGLRCQTSADCPSALPCAAGFCRCQQDAECGQTGVGGGFYCQDPPAGTAGAGKTCRAGHVITGGAAYGVPTVKYHGVRIYADVLDRWVSSRMIWSQHAYAITHISETGTVARTSQWSQNFKTAGLNNFRQNTQGDLKPNDSPDTTSAGIAWSCDAAYTLHLAVQMCNRGTAPVGAGTPLAFYKNDPASRVVLCTAATPGILDPGACIALACDAPNQTPNEIFSVTAVADDPGTGTPRYAECLGTNNTMTVADVMCPWLG
ncbi:MAG TPA: VCBS repeat-containing protein [Polyangia bacterium]|jgi:hypothetical protein